MNTSTANTSTEDRALELLSSGIEPEQVASALGVSASRISQLIANAEFSARLAEKKFESLKKHNETDNHYDTLERKALAQLERTLPIVMDPLKLTRIVSVLNSAKRRGSSAPDALTRKAPTIRLNISTAAVARFSVNGANQVVQAQIGNDSQDLVTIQSGNVQRLLNEHAKTAITLQPPEGVDKNSREWRAHRRELKANAAGESDGVVWNKSQGREKQDLLSELGFAHEIEISTEDGAGAS